MTHDTVVDTSVVLCSYLPTTSRMQQKKTLRESYRNYLKKNIKHEGKVAMFAFYILET
jgi:hypothetical protein